MYQVLARKWRPQSFDTLIGQQHVARTLRNALEAGRLAHAYIFSGLRGTGKTSVARILAKCLNCESGPTPVPCNSCTPCKEISDSRSIDVLEVDAASRTKVDQTRELLETLSYAPVRDRYKILIIDEAHMLSAASFNALLKTLEEPPPRVTFILATTVLQKILPTIRSRCQVFEFRRVGVPELTGHLKSICEEEGIEISDSGLERISRAGEGSIRDSLSVLERVVAFSGKQVPDEDVLQALGGVRGEVLNRMVGAMAGRDAAAMLSILDGMMNEGCDLLHFWSEMIDVLRDLQVMAAVPDRSDLLNRSPEEAAELRKSAGDLTLDDISRIFKLFSDMEFGLKSSTQPRFLFESVLIRIASLGTVRPIEEVLESLRKGGPGGGSGGGPSGRPRQRPAASPQPRIQGNDRRRNFEAAVKQEKQLLAGLLAEAAGIEPEGNSLVVTFPAGSESLARQAERDDYMAILTAAAREVYGKDLKARIRVASATAAGEAGTAGDAGAPQPGTNGTTRFGQPERKRDLMDSARSEPGVKKLLYEFGAQVIDIRPLGLPRNQAPENASDVVLEEPT